MDSVRCSADSTHQFTCDVRIDSDFDAPAASSPATPAAPASAVPPPPLPVKEAIPAVSALVSTFSSKTFVTPPPTPLITEAALKQCVSSEVGMALAAATRVKSAIVSTLLAGKAALDAAVCIADVQKDEVERKAEGYCLQLGGVVTGVTDVVTCQVHERAK